MLYKTSKLIFVVVINLSFYNLFAYYSNAYPFSTQDRWIIDESTGQRFKLVCANWAGHLQPMLPEGLDKQPLRYLVAQVVKNKFNCIRLTYAVYMWTRYGNHIVEDTLKYLDIPEVVKGIEKTNPSLLKMTHIQVFDLVVKELGAYNVKVLLDNHVSEPKWCCNKNDENGFFNDRNFKPVEWLQGLHLAAKHFSGNSAVVAMSLRNELRGPRQNEGDWYNYMAQGAAAIHKTNAEVLVVVSGLNYDTEFQFLKKKPMKIDLGKKLVYETHLYSWSGVGTLKLKDIWTSQPLNRICANSIEGLENQAGFLTTGKDAAPLILSEFGFDQLGSTVSDNKFLTCLQTYLVEKDLDWCLWAFHGGYYLREDKVHPDESFGVLDASWKRLRYPNFSDKFQLLQRKNQDPSSKISNEYILYHPLSGQCVQVNRKNKVEVGSCRTKDRWMHDADGAHILLVSNKKCLTATREGIPTMISDDCNKSSWKSVSLSKLHLATTDQNGEQFCLQKDSNSSRIVTSKCICIQDDSTCLDDPQNQWFKLVPTNV